MFGKLIGKVIVGGLLVSALGSCLLAVATVRDMRPLPNDLAELTRASVKPQLLDREGRPLTVTYQNRWNAHTVTPLHRVPLFLQRAFILAEDKRFYQHQGIDWTARFNALWQNVLARRGVRGASTISEQVVRMLHPRPRSVWARWIEGWEARRLEKKQDKATILEFYLNQVPYAAQRRGVQQAASYYFDRDLDTLSQKEMLALAVLVRAPSRFDLHKSTQRIEGRLQILAQRAVGQGWIGNIDQVTKTPLAIVKPRPMADVSHFSRWVYDRVAPDSHSLSTTLDSQLQYVAQKLLDKRLSSLRSKGVANAGMLVIDHRTDEVLVWAVGSNDEGIGAAFDTIQVRRQPGSTLKPFVYASALENGWTAATMIDDSPLQEGVGQGVHAYRNYSNTYYGELPLRSALGNSLNIPAIKAAQFVGVEPLMAKLHELGIKGLDRRSVEYGNGIALGNGEVNLYSLVGAYATLARGGQYRPLRTTQSSESARGLSVYSPEVSSLIGHILSDTDARALEFGRGGALYLPVQTAVKTGTSNDYRDAWVVGYNYRYVVGVWMGNLDNEPMDRVTGSSGPAMVLRAMFTELNRGQQTQPLFLSRKLVMRDICIDTGLISNEQCAARKEWFLPDNQPSISPPANRVHRYALAQPVDQMRVARDPRIPDDREALEFKLNQNQGVKKVEWLVNNSLVAATASASYHWPLQTGKHVVTARVFTDQQQGPITTQSVSVLVK